MIYLKINLKKSFFGDREFVLTENGGMRATAFRYASGVEALKIENDRGYFIILPFQGQQIWRACFDGRDLTMKSKFDEPRPTKEYLKTYGGFLLHCGIGAFGVPQENDSHPLHGEIPNAEYQSAYIICGDDYIAVGGHLAYDEALNRNYTFSPECRLYMGETFLKVNAEIENRRHTPMEYMYLCHINFRPVDGAELVYSADCDKEHIKVFKQIADWVPEEQKHALRSYMEKVQDMPQLHHKIGGASQIYDPEICFAIKYKTDRDGRAYTLQLMDGGAWYVSHPANILPTGIRWIARTRDEDALGMVLPATGEHLGYENAKKRGEIKLLPPLGKVSFTIEAGYLDKEHSDSVRKKIEEIKNV